MSRSSLMSCMIGDRGRWGVRSLGHWVRKQRCGFTVIELLVVVAIFSIGSLAISATYINFTRLHRRAANAELLGEEIRFAMELMVRAARNNQIYYVTDPYPWRTTLLALLDDNGEYIYIQKFDELDSECSGLNGDCLALQLEGGGWTPITGKNVHIEQFDVFVTPLDDPFQSSGIGVYANDIQPRVTIVMEAEYRGANERESTSMSIQTTVSSRVYVR